MNILDMRTLVFSNLLTVIVCLWVIALLWRQSRNRFAGTAYWVIFFVCQAAGLALIILRDVIPDWTSIIVANALMIAGLILVFVGLERFLGKKAPQIQNILLLILFIFVHGYFTLVQPSLPARTLNISVAGLLISSQCVWLMWRRVEPGLRPLTFEVGLVFFLICLVNAIRIGKYFITEQTDADFFQQDLFEALVHVSSQALLILLAYSLFLMVNKRLLMEVGSQEEKFTKAFHSAPYVVMLTSLSTGTIVDVNETFLSLSGYDRAEVLGKTLNDLKIWSNEEDRMAVVDALSRTGRVHEMELDFQKRNGEKATGLYSAEVITIDGKKHVLSSISDITGRKRAEQEMVMLAEVGRVIGSTLEIDRVYERMAAEIGKLIRFDSLIVNLFDAAQETLTVAYASGLEIPGRQVGDLFPMRGSLAEENLRTREGVIVQSESPGGLSGKFPGLIVSARAGMHSVMSVPLIAQDVVIGNLHVRSKKKIAYDKQDLHLAEKIGMQIAGAIVNARLFSEIKQVGLEHQLTIESLRRAFGTTVRVLASAVETRDPHTAGHQIRSADLSRAIATEMGLPQEKIDAIRMAGTIHDIGKLSIPAEILSKPTTLSEIEFSLIREHARKGYEMLKEVESPWPLAEIVYQHHERMDGSGYPINLKGEEICMEARILAVADVVEAMASHRPYRPGLGIDAALNEIEKNRGLYYDDAVADACLRLFREKGFQLAGT